MPSYTEEEKLQIAKRHLLPRQVQEHGLAAQGQRDAWADAALMRRTNRGLYPRGWRAHAGRAPSLRVVRKAAVDNAGKRCEIRHGKRRDQGDGMSIWARCVILRDLPEKEPRVGVVNRLGLYHRGRRNAGGGVCGDGGQAAALQADRSAGRCDEGKRRGGAVVDSRPCGGGS